MKHHWQKRCKLDAGTDFKKKRTSMTGQRFWFSSSRRHDADDGGVSINPFVNPRQIKVQQSMTRNPFMEEEPKQFSGSKGDAIPPRNPIMEKLDPEIAERIKQGERLTDEEALLLTIHKISKRIERMEEKEDCLVLKVAELEDLLEDKNSEIKALEFRIKEKHGTTSLFSAKSEDCFQSIDFNFGDAATGDAATFYMSNPHRPSLSSTNADVNFEEGNPPPKLTSSFGRAGEKLRRAKKQAADARFDLVEDDEYFEDWLE